MNSLKQALDEKRFACVLEVIPQQSPARLAALEPIMRRGQLAGWPLLPAFADRVGPHADLSPLQGAGALGDPASSLLHFSGKDRERADLLRQMAAMGARGLKQLLLLSGDRLPGHDPGRAPVRYLESVPALQIAREHGPDWLLGAALNPFKYREEEGGAQYLKARKKLLAGADFLTLQLGFDAAKHIEAQAWMHTQPGAKPMLACVMNLSERRADVLQAVPGIVITESMRQLLGKEREVSHAYASARSLARLALQIVGLQWMGYAGVHLSGVHTLDELLLLEQAIIEQRGKVTSLADWSERWQAGWRLPGAPEVRFTPASTPGRWGRPMSSPPAASACATRCLPRCMNSSSIVPGGSAAPSAGRDAADVAGRRGGECVARGRADDQAASGRLRYLWQLPLAGHALRVPRDLPKGSGERPLWRHPAQSLRIRRPGMRAQRQVSDRQVHQSAARAGTDLDSRCRGAGQAPQFLAGMVQAGDSAPGS